MQSFKKIMMTVGIFLLIVSLLSAFFIGCYLRGENYHYQDGRERDEVAGSVTYIICGTSYTLFGIHPDLISARQGVRCYSLAGTMLTLHGRYVLLKQELERNPKVHTVLFEVSPSTLIADREEDGPNGDLQILGRLNDAGMRWEYFQESFPVREWPAVYYDLVSKGIESAEKLVMGSYTTENLIMKSGYYENHNPDKYIPSNYAELYHVQTLPETVIPENVEWLEKIIALCKEHNATVYLISTPQTKYYNCINSNLDFFQNWFSDFAKEHGLIYYNFNLAKNKLELLPDDTCFYDETHLNTKGGEIFTGMLIDIMSHRFKGRNNDFYFFKSYEELTWASDYFD
jgi:hypothetical protein